MRNFITKFPIIAVMAVILGIFTGCDDPANLSENGTFSVSFKEAGPGYVELNVTSSTALEAAYDIRTSPRSLSKPEILFATAKGKLNITPDTEVVRISADIQENTQYYLYIAAKLNVEKFSEIYEFEFTTGEFEFTSMLTVVGVDYDGYKMNIRVPSSVKNGKTAIRYNQSDLMMYNFMTTQKGVDDYFSLLYNASEYTTQDKVLEYSEAMNVDDAGVDINGDGVVDENDLTIRWNPISPGEPVVFIAGEFEWMEEPEGFPKEENYKVNGFSYPAGWEPGYYLPCIDSTKYWGYYYPDGNPETGEDEEGTETKSMNIIDVNVKTELDSFWTGAFERKTFKVKEPSEMEPKVNISVENIGPVNATVIFEPDEGVSQFAYVIMDDGTLELMTRLCDGHEEYFQWAITSFFGYYSLASQVGAGYTEVELEKYFVNVPSESNIHVLATAMGINENYNPDDPNDTPVDASKQSFTRYTFKTTEKKMGRPSIVVTALPDSTTAFCAAFNVKCTTYDDPERGPVDEVYYGANYKKDFILEVNRGSSYQSLASSQAFTKEDIAKINSEDGLTVKIDGVIDGETIRLAVIGYNIENTPNDLNYKDILECPAVADCTTPYRDRAEQRVSSELFTTLLGDWTATATLSDGSTHTSLMRISNGINAGDHYPAELPDSVITIYEEEAGWTDQETIGYFEEFKYNADAFNKHRLLYQNNLLIEGWIDKDPYNRLDYISPWDLFISRELSSVDVKSMFSDFGPKMYLNIDSDENLSITSDMFLQPPVSYAKIPYYMAGYNPLKSASEGNIVFYYDNYAPITFPVELSEDGQTLTIKPIVDINEDVWYPNLVGSDLVMGYQMPNPIISEVTLTKGWNGNETAAVSKRGAAPVKVSPETFGNPMPVFTYKHMTRFKKQQPVTKVSGHVTTAEEFINRMDKAADIILNQKNN